MVVLPRTRNTPTNPLDEPLLYFDQDQDTGLDSDAWTFDHAFQGTQIFGGTGSGKTTGSGRTLALALLTARFAGQFPCGGLVLAAKPEELALWADPAPSNPADLGYCPLVGRQKDVMVIGTNYDRYRAWGIDTPEGGHCFNFLQYELGHAEGGKLTQNLVSLFYTALEAGQQRATSSSDPYWEDALRQLLTNAIDLVVMAMGSLSIQDLARVILTAPHNLAEAHSEAWQRGSFCWECLDTTEKKLIEQLAHEHDPERHAAIVDKLDDFRQTAEYWLLDFAGLAERTRSVIVSSFTSKATAMLRSPMRQLFSPAKSTVTPDDSHTGRIIVLDLSLKEYGEVGRFAQVLFKTVWQRATERRKAPLDRHPVFLWADESQYFVTTEDLSFQQTARSKLAATVYLSQNVSNYYAAMGGRGRAAADSLLGNLQTKIFHAQGDPTTNEWAQRLFGLEPKSRRGTTFGQGISSSEQESMEYSVPVSRFIALRKGGRENPTVQGIVFRAGARWLRKLRPEDTEKRLRPGVSVDFHQDILRPTRK